MISHTAKLPHGYIAEFRWALGTGFQVLWEPDVPDIRSARPRAKFVAAYVAERATFTEMLAATLGKRVLVVDAGDHSFARSSVIDPPIKQ